MPCIRAVRVTQCKRNLLYVNPCSCTHSYFLFNTNCFLLSANTYQDNLRPHCSALVSACSGPRHVSHYVSVCVCVTSHVILKENVSTVGRRHVSRSLVRVRVCVCVCSFMSLCTIAPHRLSIQARGRFLRPIALKDYVMNEEGASG